MSYQRKVSQRYSDALTQVSWQEFERLLASYYVAQGYRVEHVGTGGSGTKFDGGIDLKLYRDDQYLIVQCKHWNVFQVTHNPVHELLGVMLTEKANGAVVITSGEFSPAAKLAAAREPRVILIDGARLREMLGPIAGVFVSSGAARADTSGDIFGSAAPNPSGHRSRRARPRRSRNPLPGLALAIVAALIAYAVSMHAIKTLAPKTATRSAVISPASPLFAPPVASAPLAAMMVRPLPQDSVTHATAAQQREWRRKNDEAMKILEKTTPTLAR